jgi:hypothetical protein
MGHKIHTSGLPVIQVLENRFLDRLDKPFYNSRMLKIKGTNNFNFWWAPE